MNKLRMMVILLLAAPAFGAEGNLCFDTENCHTYQAIHGLPFSSHPINIKGEGETREKAKPAANASAASMPLTFTLTFKPENVTRGAAKSSGLLTYGLAATETQANVDGTQGTVYRYTFMDPSRTEPYLQIWRQEGTDKIIIYYGRYTKITSLGNWYATFPVTSEALKNSLTMTLMQDGGLAYLTLAQPSQPPANLPSYSFKPPTF